MLRPVALVALLVAGVATPAVVPAATPTEPAIVATVPNPVADGDAGESVVLAAPDGTDLGAYALDDGESRVRLPNRTVSGRVVLTAAPERVRNRTDRRVLDVALPALSNAGERLRLLRGTGPSRRSATGTRPRASATGTGRGRPSARPTTRSSRAARARRGRSSSPTRPGRRSPR
ncbi:hypothetical protein [Halosegnis marinus]|uniref:hypothetical protein n=1 Tax=Halosegnis marinus TaxID=3034023 RepID=UPI0036232703